MNLIKSAKAKYENYKQKYHEQHDEQHQIEIVPNSGRATTVASPNFQQTIVLEEEPKKESTYQKFKHHLKEAEDYVGAKVKKAEETVKNKIKKLDESIQKSINNHKEHLNEWIAHKVDEKAVKMLQKVEPKITKSVNESVPLDWMRPAANDAVLHLWKDVSDLIRLELKIHLETPKSEVQQKRELKLLEKFRVLIIYSLYPADLNQREHMRRPSFVILKTLQFILWYSIQSYLFLLIFILIDRTDEYQLVQFIVELKSVQFVSMGFVGAFLGYFEYFLLANGPGLHDHIYVTLASCGIQILLPWIAFYLISKSEQKGTFVHDSLNIPTNQPGGRTKYVMMYEAFLQFLVLTIGNVCYFTGFKSDLAQLLYFCKCIYGLLSFPHMIFFVPFFVKLLTAAIPTGYDRYGNCIPVTNKIMIHYKTLPVSDNADKIDIGEVLQGD